MDILVQRKWFTSQSTSGEMSLDGKFFAYTLEPRQDQSKGKPFAIPAGLYQVRLLPSDHFQCTTPHVLNVPGFDEIEIHWGNYPKDTEGCTLIGLTRLVDFVGNSKMAFNQLMAQLAKPISITYQDNGTTSSS